MVANILISVHLVVLGLLYPTAIYGAKNVLFIMSDDLRPQLGCYKGIDFPSEVSPTMHTPNIDALASRGTVFRRAHVQQALCSPSRASLLTGRRPETTRVYNLDDYWREVGGNFTTIPQYFKENGYNSIGVGKIFHSGSASGGDDPLSWSERVFKPPSYGDYWRYTINDRSWYTINDTFQETISPLQDAEIFQYAKETIQRIAPAAISGQQNFFLGVGFKLPHLPFIFPEEFLDLYPEEDIQLPSNPWAPYDMPSIHWSKSGELRNYADIAALGWGGEINTTLPDSVTKDLRRAYYGAVSYVDSLVGELLETLRQEGLENDTVVVFLGDHGFQLGEHGLWNKHTNFETSTHAPLIIKAPGITDQGTTTRKLVEFVDLFPTLVELTGLPDIPLCPEDSSGIPVCTEGISLMPVLQNPDVSPWKNRIFMQYRRGANNMVMGYAMRTSAWKFIDWYEFDLETNTPDFSKPRGTEMYDSIDDKREDVNLAGFPEAADQVDNLRDLLFRGWREALPSHDD